MDADQLFLQTTKVDDYYAVLGVSESSSREQIQTEYRLLALKLHPDKNLDGNTNHQFGLIQLAYETLQDPEKRADYDRWRHSGLEISYEKWKSLTASRMSVHWSDARLGNLPIEQSGTKPTSTTPVTHAANTNDIRAQFRSYRI